MRYLYHPHAKESFLALVENDYKYIIKARRHTLGDKIFLRNLSDAHLYRYEIQTITKKEAHIALVDYEIQTVEAKHKLHIGWCMIDPKSIEKSIASLNEMGVDKITFIYCDRSQKNFKIDSERLEKILISSSSQCGRSSIITLEHSPTLEDFKRTYPNSLMVNFSTTHLAHNALIDTLVIGCEGGFTAGEMRLYEGQTVGFDTPLILKSQSAALAVASKVLL